MIASVKEAFVSREKVLSAHVMKLFFHVCVIFLCKTFTFTLHYMCTLNQEIKDVTRWCIAMLRCIYTSLDIDCQHEKLSSTGDLEGVPNIISPQKAIFLQGLFLMMVEGLLEVTVTTVDIK